MRIPTLDPREQPQQTNQVEQTPGDVNQAASSGRDLVNLGGAIQDAGDVMFRAKSAAEIAEASNIADLHQAQLKAKAAQETEWTPEKLQKYHSQLEQGVREAADKISTPLGRQNFTSRYGAQSGIVKLELEHIYNTAQVNKLKAQTAILSANNMAAYISAPRGEAGAVARGIAANKLFSQMRTNLAAHVYGSAEEMQAEYQKQLQVWDRERLQYDILQAPEGIEEAVNKGEYGTLPPTDKQEFIKKANDRIEQKQKIAAADFEAEKRARERTMYLSTMDTSRVFADQSMPREQQIEAVKADITQKLLNKTIDPDVAAAFEYATHKGDSVVKFTKANNKVDKYKPSGSAKILIEQLNKLGIGDENQRKDLIDSAILNYAKGGTEDGSYQKRADLIYVMRAALARHEQPDAPRWGQLSAWASKLADMKAPVGKTESENSVGFHEGVLNKFQQEWDMKSDPAPVMQKAIQQQHKEVDPRLAGLEVGQIVSNGKKSARVVQNADGTLGFEVIQ